MAADVMYVYKLVDLGRDYVISGGISLAADRLQIKIHIHVTATNHSNFIRVSIATVASQL